MPAHHAQHRPARIARGRSARWLRRCAGTIATLALVLAGAALLHAQDRYGDATVEAGRMTLVRDGERFGYAAGEPAVVVRFGDVLVAHERTRVVIESVEHVRLTLGANAAFEIRPFKQRGALGVLRLIFGRIRAQVQKLSAGQVSIKTAQAVIGIKGTEFVVSVTAQGDTLVVVDETDNQVVLTGLEGPERAIAPNLMAAVVNSRPVSDVAVVTPEARETLALEDLSVPVAYRPEARALRGEEVLVQAGIVSEKDLQEAKRERATLQDAIRFDEEAPTIDETYSVPEQTSRRFRELELFLRPPR